MASYHPFSWVAVPPSAVKNYCEDARKTVLCCTVQSLTGDNSMATTAVIRIDEICHENDSYYYLAPIGASVGIFIISRSIYMNEFGSAASIIAAVGVSMIGAGYILTAARKFIIQANKDGISKNAPPPDSKEIRDMIDQEKLDRVRKMRERREKDTA